MRQHQRQTMERYLAELKGSGNFTDIAMQPDLRFTGPLVSTTTADEYRSISRDLADSVRDISLRTLVGDGDVVHAVYDVDMGLASGPLLTSQTVEFLDGAMASVEVIFDAAVITESAA